jgi:hypothetical protein
MGIAPSKGFLAAAALSGAPGRLCDHCLAMAVTEATITCPGCGADKRETMPENACRHFYTCWGCGAILRPLEGDCCVFCSYADQLCPPKQAGLPC